MRCKHASMALCLAAVTVNSNQSHAGFMSQVELEGLPETCGGSVRFPPTTTEILLLPKVNVITSVKISRKCAKPSQLILETKIFKS